MNKAQLIEALAERLGDKKVAMDAVDGLVDIVIRTVHKGEKVNVTGFGVFEKRARAARTARNPRTGETVKVKKTNVPAFRPGTTFKDVLNGTRKVTAKVSLGSRSTTKASAATAAAKPATRRAAAKPAAAKAAPKRAAAAKVATKAAAKPRATAAAKPGRKKAAK